MCFDRDFATESKISDAEFDTEHRELVNDSETIEELLEELRAGIQSPGAIGLLLKQEMDRLKDIAEERLAERDALEACG